MAFEDEYEAPRPPTKIRGGPITSWDSSPLFTLLVQFGSGFLLVMQWGVALALLPLIIEMMPPTGPVDPIGSFVMILFFPLGLVQLYLAYRLYNMVPGTLKIAFVVAIWIIIMSGIIIVTSILAATQASFQLPVVQIGINVVLAYLTQLRDVTEHFDGLGQQPFQ